MEGTEGRDGHREREKEVIKVVEENLAFFLWSGEGLTKTYNPDIINISLSL